MDRLGAMAMLVTVADTGSLSAASRTLAVPLATLSRRVADLEALLGARLLYRTTRKLSLTEAGVSYVSAARRILEQVEEAERNAVGELTTPKGELVVTAPLMFGRLHVLPVVSDFLEMHGEINIRLVLADRNVDLIDDRIDMAVRIGKLPDSSMVATQIGTIRTVTCGSPALLARHGVPRTPDALSNYPCIAVDALSISPSWRFRDPTSRSANDVAIRPRLTVTTPEAAADAAVRGVGLTHLFHYQASDAMRRKELRIILKAFEPAASPVHLVHISRGHMPLKMRHFLDFAAPRLRDSIKAVSAQGTGRAPGRTPI